MLQIFAVNPYKRIRNSVNQTKYQLKYNGVKQLEVGNWDDALQFSVLKLNDPVRFHVKFDETGIYVVKGEHPNITILHYIHWA